MADNTEKQFPDASFNATALEDLGRSSKLKLDLERRNTVGDTAVGLVDTLQSLGNIPLAALPGYQLQDAASNSRFLDQYRSPAYHAAREVQTWDDDPNAGFLAQAADAFGDTLTSGNIIADATAQAPYLLMGPASRLAGVARAEKAAGILGKAAKYTLGTNEAATVNRIAAFSGAMEGAGGYAQTYERALAQTGDPEIAEEQARKAGAVNFALGAALGRVTPAFELHPTGARGSTLASHISAIGGEAVIEEGGLAVGSTAFDNILAGKDPMEGTGQALGEAMAVSGVFSGALRSPAMGLDAAREIGKDVLMGAKAVASGAASVLGKNVVTPQEAAVQAANEATQTTETPPPPASTTPAEAAVQAAQTALSTELGGEPPPAPPSDADADALIAAQSATARKAAEENPAADLTPEEQAELEALQGHFRSKAEPDLSGEDNNFSPLTDEQKDALETIGVHPLSIDGGRALVREMAEYSAEKRAEYAKDYEEIVAGHEKGLERLLGSDDAPPMLVQRQRGLLHEARKVLRALKAGPDSPALTDQSSVPRLSAPTPPTIEGEDTTNRPPDENEGPGEPPPVEVSEGEQREPSTNKAPSMIEAVLADAGLDVAIENTEGAKQASLIAKKDELASIVNNAVTAVNELKPERVASIAAEAAAGNTAAGRSLDAIRHVDATKVPESALTEAEKPVVQQIRRLNSEGINKTSREIMSEGFNGDGSSRGVQGYLQAIMNLARQKVKRPTYSASELERFVTHLTERAALFQSGLDELEQKTKDDKNKAVSLPIMGTQTRDKKGLLTKEPFVLHNKPGSIAVAEAAVRDARLAQAALDAARKSFPEQFKAKPATKAEAKPAQKVETPKPVVAPVAPVTATETKAEEKSAAPVKKAAQKEKAEVKSSEANSELTAAEKVVADNKALKPGTIVKKLSKEQGKALKDKHEVTSVLKAVEFELGKTEVPSVASIKPKAPTPAPVTTTASTPAVTPASKAESKTESTAAPAAVPIAPKAADTTVAGLETPLAEFNGTNRLEEAFTPNKKGLLATSFDETMKAMEEGTEAEKLAAKQLKVIVPGFVKQLNNYIQEVLNREVSVPGKGKMKLKDALATDTPLPEYRPYIWINSLIKTGEGEYALHPAVAQAMGIAATMGLTRLATQRADVSQDDDDAAEAQYFAWTDNLARDTIRVLGMKENTNESLTAIDGIPKSLAATIVQVLAREDYINLGKVTKSNKQQYKIVSMESSDKQIAIAKVLRRTPIFNEIMKRLFGASDNDTISFGKPPKGVKKTVRRSRHVISEQQHKAVANRQKVKHNRNTGFITLIDKLGGSRYVELLTGYSKKSDIPELEEISRSLVSGVTGELNAMFEYNAALELYAKENGDIAPEDVEIFFQYEILRNGRSYSGFSPQTKKTLREFLTSGRVKLDLSNEKHLRGLKIAIAQSLNIKTDINTHAEVIDQLEQLLAPTEDGQPSITQQRAMAVYQASQGKDVADLNALLERDELYSPKELHGLMTLGKYLSDPTSTEFDNTLTFEIDGKTNGPFNAEVLFGLWEIDHQTDLNLAQGGFFRRIAGATIASMRGETRKLGKGTLDLYERVAKKTVMLRVHPVLQLAEFVTSTNEVTRSTAKEAVTPLVYGSGVEALTKRFAKNINTGLAERLRIELKHCKKDAKGEIIFSNLATHLQKQINSPEVQQAAEDLAESLATAYLKEKPQVNRTNKLLVGVTGLHAAIRKAKFSGMVQEEVSKQREAGTIPKQYDLSRDSYNEILEKLPSTLVQVPGMGTVYVGENSFTGRTGSSVRGAGDVNELHTASPEVQDPGVSISALLTQAAGDAAMTNLLFQEEQQLLDVYDGIEMSVDMIDDTGLKLGQVSYDCLSDSLLDGFIPLMKWVNENKSVLYPENLNKTLLGPTLHAEYLAAQPIVAGKAPKESDEKAFKEYEEAKRTVAKAEKVISQYKEEMNLPFVLNELAGRVGHWIPPKTPYTSGDITGVVDKTIKELPKVSALIKKGRALLDSEASSNNQMSGGGVGYTTTAKKAPRKETVTAPFREGWNDTIEAGFDANNGQLTRSGVIALLDGHKWNNKVHKAVWNKLRNMLPESLLISLAKNAEQWYALSPMGVSGVEYGSVNGTSYYSSGIINLATADPVTLLHELTHQVITGHLTQYFANINAVPVALRASINDLHQLLKRFLTLKGNNTTNVVQGLVKELEATGDTAAAIDEMVAHVLTNEAMITEFQPTLYQRVVNRMKQIMSTIFGTAAPESFQNEVLQAFHSLASTEPMDIVDTVRHSPVIDSTIAVLKTISQKVSQGQITDVPKVKNSGLDNLLGTYNLNPEQKKLYQRVWMLLRMGARPGTMEEYAATVLKEHPNAALFNGTIDAVASVMALTAVESTFQAQADILWRKTKDNKGWAQSLVDMAISGAATQDSKALLTEAFDAMRTENELHMSFLGTATQRLDRIGNEWIEKVGKTSSKLAEKAPGYTEDILLGISALTTEEGADAYGETLLNIVNNVFKDQRWAQDLTAAFMGSQEDSNAIYRQVSAMKATVSQNRSAFTISLPAKLKTLFSDGFDGWNNLYTHFGRLDAGVLGESAGEMFSDNAARAKTIKALESKITNLEDAKNLASYMVTGSKVKGSTRALLKNAHAIANNILDKKKKEASADLIANVDQLITLYAIEMLNKSDRNRIAGYFKSNPKGMNNLVGMLQKVAAEEAAQYDERYRYDYWKGALPLSTDPRTSIVLASPVKGAELEGMGYRKDKRYVSSSDDPLQDLHYYVRDYAPPPVFSQGIFNTVQQTAMGVNYVTAATISPEVTTLITNPRSVKYITDSPTADSLLTPLFNYDGDIVGYERLLDRKYVQSLTKSDNTLLHISIGAKLGRITEERMADRFNQIGIEVLVQQWESGKAKNQQDQYESVNSTTDKQIARAWEVIPAPIKKALEEAFDGPVMIRRDLIVNTIGNFKAGSGDVYTGEASLSENTRKALIGLAQTVLGPNSAKYILAAELAIKEGVATAKDWIIVRTVTVALANAYGAMHQVIANGVPITEMGKSYAIGIRDMRAYFRLEKERIELTVKIAGATTPAEVKRLTTLQHAKDESIKRLAIYPLIESGELSDLPEGLEEAPDHSYIGDFTGWLNNHLRVIHPKAPAALANVLIAKDTPLHDALSKAIQAGDFLAKWTLYRHEIKKGKSKQEALDKVRDELVDYSTNPGRFRGLLEDLGVVWWSQWTIKAQRVLLQRFRRNPFSFFLSAGFGTMTGTDSIADIGLHERNWDSSTGQDNMVSAPSSHIFAKIL